MNESSANAEVRHIPAEQSRLEQRIVLVTGAASGIGLATAALFSRQGAIVYATDMDGSAVARAAASLVPPSLSAALDVRSAAAWQSELDRIGAAHGRLDVLVNNAGIARAGSIETATPEQWHETMAINAFGVFLGAKLSLPLLRASGQGAIVNVSSVAGLVGNPDLAAYCASKGAVRLLTKSIALHCAQNGYSIRCNSVHPSYIETPLVQAQIRHSSDSARARRQLEMVSPLRRLGTAEEVAAAIVFLASPAASFINGTELAVDGGTTAR